jgi:microcystin-dependent protein
MDRFLLGSGATYASGQTGGESTHTLTADEMPKHQHAIGYGNNGAYVTLNSGSNTGNYLLPWEANKGYSAADLVALEAGGGNPHNNMPPYLVVNMWKRIA